MLLLINFDCNSIFEGIEGYVVQLDVREEGEYELEIFMSWVYGDAEGFEGPTPVLVSW
jgi:hypothetical protein